ncbi:hypothetical protein IEO21_06769 [Rhodonia placenta]|uniref:Uncharacterized protein n=1 Tax=Rhodonia placenta TaxID=104341 RepID=A0A8H7NZL2_9APHY|nr:hypothetical protein IEO21_06769 [Postia placenta]
MSSNDQGTPEKGDHQYYQDEEQRELDHAQNYSAAEDKDPAPPPPYEQHHAGQRGPSYENTSYAPPQGRPYMLNDPGRATYGQYATRDYDPCRDESSSDAGPDGRGYNRQSYDQERPSTHMVEPTRPSGDARIAANYSELGSQATSSSSGSGTRNLINTPPPSFQRAPPPGLPYPPFPPVALRTASSDLSKGFPKVPPPPPGGEPHPFATHDVHEEDWTRFLNDVKEAAALSTTDRSVSNVAPLALGVSFGVAGKSGVAGELIDRWNNQFFHPRHMNVVLAQGPMSYSGPDVPPPDIGQYEVSRAYRSRDDLGLNSGSESSSSSSSCSSDNSRRKERREREHDRRKEHTKHTKDERKKQREQRREGRKDVKRQPWRLVVAYYQPAYGQPAGAYGQQRDVYM